MNAVVPSPPGRPGGVRFLAALKGGVNFLGVILLTYLGLLAVTFFIGRVMPIDPVLAVVGDRAPEHVVERVREGNVETARTKVNSNFLRFRFRNAE